VGRIKAGLGGLGVWLGSSRGHVGEYGIRAYGRRSIRDT
jgi:hypothetical protein